MQKWTSALAVVATLGVLALAAGKSQAQTAAPPPVTYAPPPPLVYAPPVVYAAPVAPAPPAVVPVGVSVGIGGFIGPRVGVVAPGFRFGYARGPWGFRRWR
jgi:hypothetical protein